MKHFLGIVCTLCLALNVAAQTQIELTDYYANTNGLNKGELKTALYNIIKNPKVVGYNNLWKYFPLTDRKANGTVWDMYSNNTYYFPEDGGTATGMDKEHAFPKSWWTAEFKADHFDCYSDLFNLNPADQAANQNIKSAYAMAEIDIEVTKDNGSCRGGTSTLYGAYPTNQPHTAWEPADEYKGDFARTYMYVVTCYEFISYATSSGGPAWSSTLGAQHQINWNSGETYPLFSDWSAKMLLDWHHRDPVSEKELNRNEVIYGIQGNRNPFIDCPEFADYIWGDKKDEAFDLSLMSSSAFFTMPKNNEVYKFESGEMNNTRTLTMQFRAQNVTKPVAWRIEGTPKGTFTLPSATIAVNDLLNGSAQKLTYSSDVPAHDTVKLVLSSDEMLAPVTITLIAETYDSFKILPPITDVDHFTIRWQPSADATSYKVTVFHPKDIGEQVWTNVLDENFVWVKFPSTWSFSPSAKEIFQQQYLKLGSGSNNGFAITPPLPTGTRTAISVSAAKYNSSTKNVYLTISAIVAGNDSLPIAKHALTGDYVLYSDTIDTADSDTIRVRLTANKGKQLNIDSLCISTLVAVETQLPIRSEFPAITTDNEYKVTDLQKDEHYWYTVQPLGGEFSPVYGPFEVVTCEPTAIQSKTTPNVSWHIEDNLITLENLPLGNDLTLYDLVGRKLFACHNNQNATLCLRTTFRGILILQLTGYQPIKIVKSY